MLLSTAGKKKGRGFKTTYGDEREEEYSGKVLALAMLTVARANFLCLRVLQGGKFDQVEDGGKTGAQKCQHRTILSWRSVCPNVVDSQRSKAGS